MGQQGYGAIYSAAALYERAFSYRDIPAEVDFLLSAYRAFSPGAPLRAASSRRW